SRAAPVPTRAPAAVPAGIAVSDASPALLDAITRLLALLDEPNAAAVLAAGVEREIVWRLLPGPQGATLPQIGLTDSRPPHPGPGRPRGAAATAPGPAAAAGPPRCPGWPPPPPTATSAP